jgi:hypothetical protein
MNCCAGKKHPSTLTQRAIGVSFILLLVFLIVPAAAAISPYSPRIVHDHITLAAGPAVQDNEPVMGVIAPVITVRPTPVPARQNRTSILQTVVKNAAGRPKVTIPASWFILGVAVSFIGLGAILYLLIHRGTGSGGAPEKIHRESPGHPTVIDTPAAAGPERQIPPGTPGAMAEFPKALEKRFLSPVFIGEGGLARVFRAKNAKTGMTVAVKVPIRFDEITGTHFTRDIVFWQALEHENIIRVFSSNILPVPYIEMEYAPSSLATLSLPVPEEKAIGIILGVARGLAYAHGKGIVHRDIKPENILIAADGTPKITDWGLGKALSDPRKSSIIGFSPSYAAPEQVAPHRYGTPGPATDIYQLGMLLCEMLTGSVAFTAEGMHDLNLAILSDTPAVPRWNGNHVAGIREIIMKCLAKRPEERYESVTALIQAIESLGIITQKEKIK